jgi:DNA-binding transcriptional ArsR family regulator
MYKSMVKRGDLRGLQENAGQAAQFLKLLSNEHRLLVLCQLVSHGEMTVNALAEAVGLSQSALSQHLALLREDGLVAFRRGHRRSTIASRIRGRCACSRR